MTREHVQDGRETFDRIGAACDIIASAYPEIADAIAGHARERRGRVQADPTWPATIAASLIRLADDAEKLAELVTVNGWRRLDSPSCS